MREKKDASQKADRFTVKEDTMRKYSYITIDASGNKKEHFILARTKAEAIEATSSYVFVDGSKILKSSFKWID